MTALADDARVEDLDLTVRTQNCLAGRTAGELRAMSDRDLLRVRNMGRQQLDEVRAVLRGEPNPRLAATRPKPAPAPAELAPRVPHRAVLAAWKRLDRAQVASTKASDARAALPPGSSRARVTTANARWASAAEERDRALEAYREAIVTECHRLGVGR